MWRFGQRSPSWRRPCSRYRFEVASAPRGRQPGSNAMAVSRGPAMTTAADPNRPQFLITGKIDRWDPATRRLEIGQSPCWVAPEVRVWDDVRAGVRATAMGYRDVGDNRRIVTQLTVD
jgi:hypothetical protein